MIRLIKISTQKPPQWILDAVKEKWGVEWESSVIFTYGDTISGHKGEMTEDLLAHETHHTIQQAKHPNGPKGWWKLYLDDDEFRFEQELECYRKQYQWLLTHIKNRQVRFEMLQHYAKSLSGPMYGELVGFHEAIKKIKE